MKAKRIGLVLSNVPGYSETFFRSKIKGLQKNGFEVILFVNENPLQKESFLCPYITAPNMNTNPIKKLLLLLTMLLKMCFVNPKRSWVLYGLDKKDGLSFKTRFKQLLLNQYLLSQELDWLHFGFGMLAVGKENVAQVIGANMAVSFRGFDLYLSPLKHTNCYEHLFKKDLKYHVLSQEMKEDLDDYGVQKQHIMVIPPAIDVDYFRPKDIKKDDSILNILTVARLHWKKGLEYTLESLYYLKQEGVKFHYTVVGEGQELERLMFTAYQLDIINEVTFMGKLPHEEVKEIMEQSHVYLQYSIQEGFCNAVLEAQSMGLLCVVSNAEGLPENVLDNQTGWVVPKRNPLALKETIKHIVTLSNEDQYRIKNTAMNRVKGKFNILQQQQDFVRFYSE